MIGGNHDRICQIISVKNDPTTCPASDQITLRSISSDIAKPTEISKRQSGRMPPVESNRRNGRMLEQRFVYGHVQRCRMPTDIAIDMQRIEHALNHIRGS